MKKDELMYKYPIEENDGWKELSGELPVKMTNDYLFRALLQSDEKTLVALLTSVLKLETGKIRSAKVTNPILLGTTIDSKTFVMDVTVQLNNDAIINLEMQVIREKWWQERSLSYICRSYDNLNKGMPYGEAKGVKQVAFCDFTLFQEKPEFYASYKILNERHPEIVYSEKIGIINIDLTRIDLAEDTDREFRIDLWAGFFKAETWEDFKMIAEKDEVIGKAVDSAWQIMEDEVIREQCRAREEWIINDRYTKKLIAEQEEKLAEQDKKLAEQDKKLAEMDKKLAEQDEENRRLRALLEEAGSEDRPGD